MKNNDIDEIILSNILSSFGKRNEIKDIEITEKKTKIYIKINLLYNMQEDFDTFIYNLGILKEILKRNKLKFSAILPDDPQYRHLEIKAELLTMGGRIDVHVISPPETTLAENYTTIEFSIPKKYKFFRSILDELINT